MNPIRKKKTNPVVTRDINADVVFKEEVQWLQWLNPETFCHLCFGETLQVAQYVFLTKPLH